MSAADIFSKAFLAKANDKNIVAKQDMHLFLTGGYLFRVGTQFKIKPSFLVKEDFKSILKDFTNELSPTFWKNRESNKHFSIMTILKEITRELKKLVIQ